MRDTSYPTALLDILQAIILSDSMTSTAINLIAAKSLRVIRWFTNVFAYVKATSQSSAEALEPLNKPPPDLPRAIQLDLTRLEDKLQECPSSRLVTPSGYLSYSTFDPHMVTYGFQMSWEEALDLGLQMAITNQVLNVDNHPLHVGHRNEPLPAMAGKLNPTIALWSLLPDVLKSISIAKFVRVVITGICACLRPYGVANVATDEVEAAHAAAVANTDLVIKLEQMWTVEQYERRERAIKLAVDIFTWPFEQVGAHLVDPLIRSSVPSPPSDLGADGSDGSSIEYQRRPKLVGPVLEEVLVEWAARIGACEVLEDAELERDVIVGCLERLTILQDASIRVGDHVLGALERNWSVFYRKLALQVLEQEMRVMRKRTIQYKTRLRGLAMLGWIYEGLVIADDQLMGTLP